MMISFIDFFQLEFPRCDVVVHELHDGDHVRKSGILQITYWFQCLVESLLANLNGFFQRIVNLVVENWEVKTNSQF